MSQSLPVRYPKLFEVSGMDKIDIEKLKTDRAYWNEVAPEGE